MQQTPLKSPASTSRPSQEDYVAMAKKHCWSSRRFLPVSAKPGYAQLWRPAAVEPPSPPAMCFVLRPWQTLRATQARRTERVLWEFDTLKGNFVVFSTYNDFYMRLCWFQNYLLINCAIKIELYKACHGLVDKYGSGHFSSLITDIQHNIPFFPGSNNFFTYDHFFGYNLLVLIMKSSIHKNLLHKV